MKKLSVLFSLIIIVSCSSAQPEKRVQQVRPGGLFAIENTERYSVDNKQPFKRLRNIAIASFKVGFKETDSEHMATLTSIDGKLMQSITESAYRDFTQKLRSRGYRITPQAKLAAADEYKTMSKYSFPYEDDQSSFFSSYGKSRYFSPAQLGAEMPIFPNEIGSFTFNNAATNAASYADKKKVRMISATYLIDFTSKPNPNSEITAVLSVEKAIISTNGAAITLDQHIASDQIYGRVRRVNKVPEYEIKANPQTYKYVSANLLRQANAGLVNKMAALR